MEDWLQPPRDRPANKSGRLCVLMAVTALLLMASPAVWASLPI